MNFERTKLALHLVAFALLANGCANPSTPEESFRSALDSACENQVACGVTEDACADAASRDMTVAETVREFRAAGATEECIDMALEIYADHFTCVSSLSCALIESGDCDDIIRDEAFDGICPEL